MEAIPYTPSLITLPKEEISQYLSHKCRSQHIESIKVSLTRNGVDIFHISGNSNFSEDRNNEIAPIAENKNESKSVKVITIYSEIFNSEIHLTYNQKKKILWFRHDKIKREDAVEIVNFLHAKESETQKGVIEFRDKLVPHLHSTDISRLQRSLELLLNELQCEIGTLWQYHSQISNADQPAMLTLCAAAGKHHLKNYTRCCLPEPHGLAWIPLRENSDDIILIKDVNSEDLANKNTFYDYKGKTLALIQLHSQNARLGTICLVGADPSIIDKKINHIRIFQDFAAVTLKEMEADGRRRILDELPHLFPQGRFSVRDLSNLVVESVRTLVSAQGASIFLTKDLDPKSNHLELTSVSTSHNVEKSDKTELFEKGKYVPTYKKTSESITALIARTGTPVVFHKISEHAHNSGYYREIADDQYDSWIGVPLVNGVGSVVGVLRCIGKYARIEGVQIPYVFSQFDLFVLSYIADLFTKFLDTIEAFERYERLTDRLALAEKIRTHEIAGPLAAISGNASFVHQHLNDVGVTSKERRLNEIISDTDICVFLLRETRLPDQAAFNKALQHGSVVRLIRDVQSFLERQIASRGRLHLSRNQEDDEFTKYFSKFMRIRVSGTSSNTMMHRWLLQRAFYNLGINAIKYGNVGGSLHISIKESRNGNMIIVDFSDNGIGVPEGDEVRIFNEGIRGSNISDYPGEGLGLSIARSIIEAHGGSLVLGKNANPTIFRCLIPIRRMNPYDLQHEFHPAFSHVDLPIPRT